jgi:4'-phosphopantetheinyl transferase
VSRLIRVWAADLDAVTVADPVQLLSPGERERAARAGSDLLRRRFETRRSLLRQVLSDAAGIGPDRLVLERRCARCGKLHPAPLFDGARTHWWSSSSAGPLMVLAVAAWPVGIDVEPVSGHDGWQAIARRYFAAGEAAAIGDDLHAFLRSWTLKEAYLKAQGLGLAGGLDTLDCTSLTADPDGWWRSCAYPMWLFGFARVDDSHMAAVAVRGAPADVTMSVDTIALRKRAS